MGKNIDLCCVFECDPDGAFMLREMIGRIVFIDRNCIDNYIDTSPVFCVPMNMTEKIYSDVAGEEMEISHLLEYGHFKEALRKKRVEEGVSHDSTKTKC